MIEDVILFLLIAIGFSCMWSLSGILLPVRIFISKIPFIRVPLLCPECCSFWIAIVLSLLWNPFSGSNMGLVSYIVISNITLGVLTHLLANIVYNHEIIQ